ncbi:hypothetical protein BDV10DRAFT_147460 [Aspergillus recurvatus]
MLIANAVVARGKDSYSVPMELSHGGFIKVHALSCTTQTTRQSSPHSPLQACNNLQGSLLGVPSLGPYQVTNITPWVPAYLLANRPPHSCHKALTESNPGFYHVSKSTWSRRPAVDKPRYSLRLALNARYGQLMLAPYSACCHTGGQWLN